MTGQPSEGRGLESVQIPLGGGLWRTLGANGSLVVGYVLAAAHLVLLLVTAVLGADREALEGLARAAFVSTAVVPLVATCFIWVGELVRRGRWGGPSGHKPDALLPQGSTTVRVRMLPASWHVLWFLVSVVVAVVLLLAMMRGMSGSGADSRAAVWAINGLLLAAVAGAVLGSLVKKRSWSRRRARAAAPRHPALARRRPPSSASRTFWRWFGYRWRLDLWCCAIGTMALWVAAAFYVLAQGDPSEAGSLTAAALGTAVGGGVVLAVGLFAATQFWRAGEQLASAESVA